MGKTNKVSKLSDSDEAKLKKLSKKERSQAVEGKPDFSDIENLRAIFEAYNKAKGGALKRFMDELRVERAFIKNLEPIERAEKFKYSFPDLELETYIRTYFPTIWTNKEHARWFLKWFPGFRSG